MINTPHPGPFLRDLQADPAQQAASAYMNFLCRPDAAALLAADDYARLWRLFTNMGGGAWLDEPTKARYRAVWRHGLDGALNYYRASPLRPPTASDPGALNVRFEAQQITVRLPTKVIWGELDTALPPRLVEGLAAWVPELELVRVPGASHWIVHEQPQRVAREIEAALGR
jgi:pimeloyl-ACP methyl ester carboxylesterase